MHSDASAYVNSHLIAKPSTVELQHGGYNRLRTTSSKTGPYKGIVVGGSCLSLVLASRRSALLASASSVTRRSGARPDLIGHRIHRRSVVYGPGQDGVGLDHAFSEKKNNCSSGELSILIMRVI
jgi:hypothetical protein